MSKTGTTSLGKCFRILGLTPQKSADQRLKNYYERTGDTAKLIKVAKKFRSFEDVPWYLVFEDLDKAFPGSKFVLTVRKNSMVHAKSAWNHGVRAGVRSGEPTASYLVAKMTKYENHNLRVREYFKNRPEDLLVLCWENGDGWGELCSFLSLPIPSEPIPHANKGKYHNKKPMTTSDVYGGARQLKRLKYRLMLILQEIRRRMPFS